jgi:hypothetical protein
MASSEEAAVVKNPTVPVTERRFRVPVSIQRAFVLPLLCYVFILYFGLSGCKPSVARSQVRISPDNEGSLA